MKTVLAAGVAAVALMGTIASASAYSTTLIGSPLHDGNAPAIGTNSTSTGTFKDTYYFSLASSSTFSSYNVQPTVTVSVTTTSPRKGQPAPAPTATIKGFTIQLYQGSVLLDSQTLATAAKGDSIGLTDYDLTSGVTYSVVVSGMVQSAPYNSVSYGGSMPVIGNTVPLPNSVAMFGAAVLGLGAYGAMRKKGAASPAV